MEKSARWLELVCMSWMRTKVETGEFLGHSPAGRQMTVVGRLWGLVELYTEDTVRGSEVKVAPVSIVHQLITKQRLSQAVARRSGFEVRYHSPSLLLVDLPIWAVYMGRSEP